MQTKFYKVGGCVRDSFLGVRSKDIDYSVESESFDTMRQAILERGGQIFLETPQYFTIRAKVPDLGAADFVLCRKDGAYTDGRRPDEVQQGTLLDDLARRDFTVNAMAEDEDGNLIDPFNGLNDLKAETLRCVGDTTQRMNEDALRMLRAIRFSITKGLGMDSALVYFLSDPQNAFLLDNVSVERIREELKKCFEFETLSTLIVLQRFKHIARSIFERNLILIPTIVAR